MKTECLIKNEHLTRQSDLIDTSKLDRKVVIIGCGAIGSFVVLALAKMGMTNLEVFDFDTIEEVNMNSQFFRKKDIGSTKAKALHDLVLDFTDVKIKYNEEAFTEQHMVALRDSIVISAVDSMEVRKLIMDMATAVGDVHYIIDPRMSAEKYAQYAYPPADFEKYAKTLYTDADAVQERCTAKATVYTALAATSIVVKTMKNIIQDEAYPKQVQWDIRASTNPMIMFPNNMGAFVEEEEGEEISTDLLEEVLEDDGEATDAAREVEFFENALLGDTNEETTT